MPPDPPPLRPESPAERAAQFPDPAAPQTAFPRLDLPSKVDGSYLFAGDVRLPNMAYAAIRHGPLDHAELTQCALGERNDRFGRVGFDRVFWTAEPFNKGGEAGLVLAHRSRAGSSSERAP